MLSIDNGQIDRKGGEVTGKGGIGQELDLAKAAKTDSLLEHVNQSRYYLMWENYLSEKGRMPTLSMFFGIIIRMYYAPKEHNPPHIYAYYERHTAVINIKDLNVTSGSLPIKQLRLVSAWIEIHQEELLADWELCQNGEKPFSIEPLK